MSAEGKKKRGEAGQSNAKNIPFRYHGYPRGYTVSTAIGRSDHPRMGGARFLHAMELAARLPGFAASHRMIQAADAVIDYIAAQHSRSRTAREWRDAAE